MATPSTVNADLVEQFIAVTGADRDVAFRLLEACAGDVDMAVGMHMDSEGAGLSNTGREGCSSTLSDDCEPDVRAPIPQRTEVLVEEETGRLDHYDESMRGKRLSKKRSLEELYRPPVDITLKGTFQNARDAGSAQNKWLLVNVQNIQEFPCQLLNRDVWSSLDARAIIRENFIFWQVYNDSEEGKWFMQFYKMNKWPYVAVLDPFTGENQITWNKISDGRVFCELVREFISLYPVPDQSLVQPSVKRQKKEPSILDASEQEQMEAAIQASLVENKTKISSPQYVLDSDSEADTGANSDEVETFSDSEDVIFSSQTGSSNGVSVGQVPTSSGLPLSSRSNSLPTNLNFNQLQHWSHSQPSSSSSIPLSTSNNSSSLDAENHIRRLPSSLNCNNQVISRASSGPSVPRMWSMAPCDSPLEVNIETSLIDMIGCRDSEVSTPEMFTLDEDSLSDSQQSAPEKQSGREQQSGSHITSQGSNTQSSQSSSQASSSWTDYWGHTSDPVVKILIRFPNNTREQVQLPCTSQLKALTVFCSGQGFPEEKYELVTNYPRRSLSKMLSSTSLQDAGLHVQETVFVQDL